ncbi:uncharacterized protein LOC119727014 [Patiria miniata]|uniref:Uncharacterized protein n=1 Tax=Patiria miniata TaxID=46514 RepID=A0A913ZTR0_PATMI|nr:uncharacterized protein LOC119727014 [Patiria miniata]
MAQESNFQSGNSKASGEGAYWWEEDFYAGKLVDLPDWSKDAGMPSASVHIQHKLDITDEPSELTNTDVLTQGFVLSKVPSLVNLSMNKIMSVSEMPEAIQVPPGLVPLLRRHQERVKLEKIQLTWLLNELMNREKTVNFHLHSCSKDSPPNQDVFFYRGCRPAWETDLIARQHLYCGYTFGYYDEHSCTYLPVAVEGRECSDWCIATLAHAIQLMLPQQLFLQKSDPHITNQIPVKKALEEALEASVMRVSHALSKVCPKLIKYCFEPALAYVWWSRGDLSKAQEVFLKLSKQMQNDIESDLQQTSDEVVKVKEWISQRALYLNEIGRLHSYVGQPELAVKYYGQAADLYSMYVPRYAVDCSTQSLVLMATAYDQGLMGSKLAIRAADSWSTLTVKPDINPNILQMAAESFLHCHTGYLSTHRDCTDNQTAAWLLEGKDLLKRLVTRAPQVNLHLSLVQAMLGEDMEAEDSYMNYVQQYASHHPRLQQQIPGAVSVFVGSEIKSHPWWVFRDWQRTSNTNKSGKPRISNPQHLRALPLVWRRRFRFCSCNTKSIEGEDMNRGLWSTPYQQVAEYQDNDLSLYLNKDGLLGGCLMQNLPPLRPVLLDPYTGRICVPGQYHEQETLSWSNCRIIQRWDVLSFTLTFDTVIPTPVHVYSSSTGVVVSLLTWNQNKGDGKETMVHERSLDLQTTQATHAVLSYSSPDSGTHTLNLVEAVVESKKMMILEQLIAEGYSNDLQVIEDASDFLDFCSNTSKNMQYNFLKTALDGDSRERCTLLDIKRQLGKTPGKCVGSKQLTEKQHKKVLQSIKDFGPLELETQTVVLWRVMLISQSTAVLALHTDGQDGSSLHDGKADTLVFVDCTNPETFSKPVIPCPSHPNAFWRLPSKDDHVGKSAKIFVAIEVSTFTADPDEDRLVIFDAKGTVLQSHVWQHQPAVVVASSCPMLGNDCEFTDLVLHSNKTKSRLRLMSTNGTIQFQTKPLGSIEHFLLVESMVFISLRDRILVLESTTLEPIEIIHGEPQFSAEQPGLPSGKNGVLLTGERSFMKVLSINKLCTSPSNQADECIQVILGVANHVFVLQRTTHTTTCMAEPSVITQSSPVTIIAKIMVPGVPTEACYLSQLDGFVVTVSLFQDKELPFYRENLYWFDINGCVQGIHPFIGPGPHCMFATELKQTPPDVKEPQVLASGKSGRTSLTSERDNMQEKQWHIFFADGLGALCCIKL